jgi:dTDP-4-amino-4,6-dideoxygalactose transaminase
MLVTDDSDLAERARLLRNHGRKGKHEHVVQGFNFRMDGIQAAILDVKLKHLPRWTERRRELAGHYSVALAGVPDLRLPEERPEATHVYHLYVVRTSLRDKLFSHLHQAGIGAGIHYPISVHRQPAFATLGYETGAFPVAERLAGEILSLPLFPELTERQIDRVVQSVRRWLEETGDAVGGYHQTPGVVQD